MGHSGGDGHPGGGPVPGNEPEPSEVWIAGASGTGSAAGHGGSGPSGAGGDGGPGRSGTGGDGGPRRGGPGGTGRTRWVALALGFVVLVAVIAVQHFAGGRSAAPPDGTGSSGPSAAARTTTASSPSPATTTSAPTSASRPSTAPPTRSAVRSPASTEVTTWLAAPQGPGHGGDSAHPPMPPRSTMVGPHLLPGATGWQLVGYGPFGVVRYHPGTGRVTVTPVPTPSSGSPDFVTTGTDTVIHPTDGSPGYLVADGSAATPLRGRLADVGPILPGPHPGELWAQTPAPGPADLRLVDLHGTPLGPRLTIPSNAGQYDQPEPDGAGYALVTGIGGVYDLRPDGATLVTHGIVLATGPNVYLAYECGADARCHTVVIDRRTGPVEGMPAITVTDPNGVIGGVVNRNGTLAAILERPSARNGVAPTAEVHLIDLTSGSDTELPITAGGMGSYPPARELAFSPDGRYLMVVSVSGRIVAMDTKTGDVTALPQGIPPVNALAVVPAG